MLQLKSIILQGFKSFDAPVTINFSFVQKGFHFITGENKVDIELEGNGVGKSGILDGVSWIYYGKTSLNLKASNVKNWTGKFPCEGTANFKLWEDDYSLKRTWKPNKLLLSKNGGEFVSKTDEEIVDLIGLDFASFLYSVSISQCTSKFFDLKPAEKLSVFSDIMKDTLDVWVKCSDLSKSQRDVLKKQIDSEELDLSNLRGRLESLQEIDYTEEKEEWAKEREEEREELLDELEELEKKYKKYSKNKKEINKSLKEINKEIDEEGDAQKELKENKQEINQEIKEINKEKEVIVESIRNIRDSKNKSNFEIKGLEKDYKLFNELEGECPHCEQTITKEYLSKKLKSIQNKIDLETLNYRKWESQIKDLEKDEKNLDKRIQTKKDALEQIEDKLDSIQDKKNSIVKKKNEYTSELASTKYKIESCEKELNRITSSLDKLDNRVNKFEEKELDNNNKIKRTKQKIAATDTSLLGFKKNYNILDYWVKGFRDLRLMLVSEALFELELNVNNVIQRLGLVGWSVKLEVDSETKKGTIKKGFTVLVKSPKNKELVPFECWSGGEGQRLKLAGTLALIEFIQNRRGVKWDLEFFDEPSQYLSKNGIDSLLDILYERPKALDKNIFIIDHRDFDSFGKFSSTYNVVKDENGSNVTVN